MKYMITWNERPQGTPIEYENAQKRILEVFSPWNAPAKFKIESFVIRVGSPEDRTAACDAVDFESRDFLILRTRELIEKSRREIAAIRSDIKTTRIPSIDRSGCCPASSRAKGVAVPSWPLLACRAMT